MSHHAHDDHGEHPKFLAHHFDDHDQQFESAKLGMWAFLAQEVLFFSGLFVAYAVYRANHPEIFVFAHRFLDANLGALNTIVLLFSSFTIAWAVRAAQLNQRKLLVGLLGITWLCAGCFMVVKYVEYSHKIHDGLLWGSAYQAQVGKSHGGHGEEHGAGGGHDDAHAEDGHVAKGHGTEDGHGEKVEAHTDEHAAAPAEVASRGIILPGMEKHDDGHHAEGGTIMVEPANVHLFFSIYFAMTGLHGIHVLAGMIVIPWIMWRAAKGHFSAEFYGPVECVALYWHLVDLVWIYLFPLLYLIH